MSNKQYSDKTNKLLFGAPSPLVWIMILFVILTLLYYVYTLFAPKLGLPVL
jgi:hypothetical protein